MLGRRDQPTLNRIVVQILKFLKYHFVAQDRLWMRALLPELVFALHFVRGAKVMKLVQEPIAFLGLEMFQ